MPEYVIMFNDEWVHEHTAEELAGKAAASRAVLDEMRQAGVLVYTNGGIDADSVIGSVRTEEGKAVFQDGLFVTRDQYLGGLCVVEVPDDEAARYWAGRIAVAVDWPQEIHRYRGRGQVASSAR